MSMFIGFLTFLLVVNCAVLVLLILAQPPKKDAGAGLAFGGGTADALFGAGSGNALTKITKWAAFAFALLALILASLQVKMAHSNSGFEQGVEQQQQQMQAPSMTPPRGAPPQPSTAPAASPSSPAMPLFSATNMPAPATTTTNKK